MSTEGAKVLCNALVHNDELSDLTLMWNNLGNKGCNIIANAVTINQLNWSFPFSLNLAYNTIGEEGATILANALRTNHLITKLDLKGNNIYCAGASALAASLKFNTILEELNLQCNGISDRGAIEIADTLAVNNVIKSLDLWGNPVRHRGAMALAEGIVQSMPDVCLEYLRVDEFWLPIKPLLGVEVKRSLDFRESCLGVLDAIIIAIFMKENKECFSLDISKNNLCGPGKHPKNPSKSNFNVSVQIIGRDNRPYGAWKEEAEALAAKEDASDSGDESDSDDDENQPLLGEGKEENEGKEGKKKKKLTKRQKRRLRYEADVQAMWERWDGVHAEPEPPIDGVEANLYGIFLLFKALKQNQNLRRLRIGESSIGGEEMLEWVWQAVEGNRSCVELLVASQDALLVQELARCDHIPDIKNPVRHEKLEIDLRPIGRIHKLEESIIERLLVENMKLLTLNGRYYEKLETVDISGQKLRYYEVVHLGNRLRNHLRCFRLNLSLCNIGNRAGLWLAPAIGTIQGLRTLDMSYNGIDDEVAIELLSNVADLRHLESILLCWNEITAKTMLALDPILPKLRHLKRLYFNGNKLGALGVMHFMKLLQSNKVIGDINLGWCDAVIKDAGCVADLMRNNGTVHTINGDALGVDDSGATNIADALLVNTSVHTLHLARDREHQRATAIGHLGVMKLASALLKNTTLTTLDLAQCQLGLHAIWEVGKVLTQNQTLMKLYLPNTIDKDVKHLVGPLGMEAFCSCFESKTEWQLQELDLSGQAIGDEGAGYLVELLQRNRKVREKLVYLNLANNDLQFDSCKNLIRALHFNGQTKYLGLEKNNLSDDDRLRLETLNNRFQRVNMMLTPVIDLKWQGVAASKIEEHKREIELNKQIKEHYAKRARDIGLDISEAMDNAFGKEEAIEAEKDVAVEKIKEEYKAAEEPVTYARPEDQLMMKITGTDPSQELKEEDREWDDDLPNPE